MKNNLILFSLVLSLGLLGCSSNPNKPSDDINEDNKDNNNTDDTNKDDTYIDTFKTENELIGFISKDAVLSEAIKSKTYRRNQTIYSVEMYGESTTILNENGTSYKDNIFYSLGNYEKTYNEEGEVIKTENYSKKRIDEFRESKIYVVEDRSDFPTEEKTSLVENPSDFEIALHCAAPLSAALSTYFASYITPKIGENEVIASEDIRINKENKEVTYYLKHSFVTTNSGYSYEDNYDISITLLENKFLKGFSFIYEEYVSDSIENKILVESNKDVYEGVLGEKEGIPADFDSTSKYFLKDFDVEIIIGDGTGLGDVSVDKNEIEIGKYLKAKAKNPIPSTSLDLDLTITKSSNPAVISTRNGVIKALKEGTSIITVESRHGIVKEFEVKVKEPKLEKIEVKLYSSTHFVGETENVYVILSPDNASPEYELINNNPDLYEIIDSFDQDGNKNGYKLNYLKEGKASITVRSTNNPVLEDTFNFEISKKLTREEAMEQIIGSYIGSIDGKENACEVIINKDENGYNGTFKMLRDDTDYTVPIDQLFNFTFIVNENNKYNDRVVYNVSDINFVSKNNFYYLYDNNKIEQNLDGKSTTFVLEMSDSNYFGYTINAKLTRK